MTLGLSGSLMIEKLKEAGLISLENRLKRGDMIQVLKLLRGQK